MADYLVTDMELESIADEIRAKGGTSSSLIFPDGFNTAINNIVGGSDFEVFTISLVNNDTSQYYWFGSFIDNGELSFYKSLNGNSSTSIQVLAYKGYSIIQFQGGNSTDMHYSGNAFNPGMYYYVAIAGDGAVISYKGA